MAHGNAVDFTSSDIFNKGAFFCYNESRKKKRAWFIFFFIGLVFLVLSIHFAGVRILPEEFSGKISFIYKSVSQMTKDGDVKGAMILFFIGSLFFFFMPLEILFLTYLANGASPWQLLPAVLSVIIISHTINYSVGKRMDALSKLLISPRKFYRLKGLLNQYGPILIFAINSLPLSSPVLSAILGTFRYRMMRFYIYVISGQLLLYSALILVYKFIIKGKWQI